MSATKWVRLGVTGTRRGCTIQQAERLEAIIIAHAKLAKAFDVTPALHHGQCAGVDTEAHEIARRHGLHIEVHPPIDRAHATNVEGDVVHGPDSHLARNRAIVDVVDSMVAVPSDDTPIDGSKWKPGQGGTVYTAKYTIGRDWPLTVVWPDGSETHFEYGKEVA